MGTRDFTSSSRIPSIWGMPRRGAEGPSPPPPRGGGGEKTQRLSLKFTPLRSTKGRSCSPTRGERGVRDRGRLQGAVPQAQIDVGLARLDPMLAGATHDLGRRAEG